MYRASSRLALPHRTILAASLSAVGVVLQSSPERREKLTIYSSPTPDILLEETPSALEGQIGVVRRRITQTFRSTHEEAQSLVSRWIKIEHSIENRVKSIISPSESLTPGFLYVGVAGLTGSILARSRPLATRLLLPPIFIYASASHLFPKTTTNLSNYLGSLEDTYFPQLAEKHDTAKAHTRMTWERIKDATRDGRQWVNHGAEVAVDKLQEATGLRLKETLGWTKAEAAKIESKMLDVAKKVEEKEVQIVLDKVPEAKDVSSTKGEEKPI